jgi:GT2 family glycosyltransferase
MGYTRLVAGSGGVEPDRVTAATVVLVTHNSQAHIESSLRCLTNDPAGPDEIIVVDNGSTDSTIEIVQSFGVKLVELGENLGFSEGCNRGAALAGNDVIVFLNPDTEPTDGWLPPLLAALSRPGVGATMPVMELTYAPGHWFTSRSALNFLGFAWSTDSGDPLPPTIEPRTVPFPSGAAFAIRRETFNRLGGFRSEYFLYLEDVDLGWRLRLIGLQSLLVPQSRVAHDYEFDRHPDKMYYLERNRWRMLLSNYRRSTVLLLAPALLAAELAVVIAALRYGWVSDKVEAWKGFWRMRKLLGEEAAHTRAIRTVSDGVILSQMDSALEGINQVPLSSAFRWINVALRLYLATVRRLVP